MTRHDASRDHLGSLLDRKRGGVAEIVQYKGAMCKSRLIEAAKRSGRI